jgi:hypothetical protein
LPDPACEPVRHSPRGEGSAASFSFCAVTVKRCVRALARDDVRGAAMHEVADSGAAEAPHMHRLATLLVLGALGMAVPCAAATPSPAPTDPHLEAGATKSILASFGIDLDAGPDWYLYNDEFSDPPTLVLRRDRATDALFFHLHEVKVDSLDRFVRENRARQNVPVGGHAIRICRGTRPAWSVTIVDPRKPRPGHPKTSGVAILSVQPPIGVVAIHLWDWPKPEDPRVRTALMNMCLTRPHR